MTDISPAALKTKLDGETRLAAAPYMRPVDAATLILLDRRAKRPKVLMGKRSMDLKFMPGKFVFPGGRLDPADARMLAAGALSPRAEMRLMGQAPRMTPSRCRAVALAAIRETFEETGLMIGTADYGPPESAPPGSWREFADLGLFPTPDALTFVARAVTPPGRPRRFDTRFFVAPLEAVGHRVSRDFGPGAELTELVWIDLADAATLDLPTITQIIVAEVAERIAAGLDRDLPVPFYFERGRRFLRETV